LPTLVALEMTQMHLTQPAMVGQVLAELPTEQVTETELLVKETLAELVRSGLLVPVAVRAVQVVTADPVEISAAETQAPVTVAQELQAL
jgi:hypothetical protein